MVRFVLYLQLHPPALSSIPAPLVLWLGPNAINQACLDLKNFVRAAASTLNTYSYTTLGLILNVTSTGKPSLIPILSHHLYYKL